MFLKITPDTKRHLEKLYKAARGRPGKYGLNDVQFKAKMEQLEKAEIVDPLSLKVNTSEWEPIDAPQPDREYNDWWN